MLTDAEIVQVRDYVARWYNEDIAQTVIEEVLKQHSKPTQCTRSVKTVRGWKTVAMFLAKIRSKQEYYITMNRPHRDSEVILTSMTDRNNIDMDAQIDARKAVSVLIADSYGVKLVKYVMEGHDPTNPRKTRKTQGVTKERMRQYKEEMRELLVTKGLL